MRIRPSSRLIILSPENHVLLFRFCHKDDALRGKTYGQRREEDLKKVNLSSRPLYANYLRKRV